MYSVLLLGLSITPVTFAVNRATRFYGVISYSVYLSHATILYLMSAVFAFIYSRSPSVNLAYGVSIALGLGAVTIISYLTYRYVESPGNKLGRAIIALKSQRSLPAAT